ncbi:unnamed protein product [Leptidea sinapis]|uniref:CRAL/TRIO N-terminal domain-containing protein n=1 Tax=Leptidea sinapis TaxID=189913 RepID=A0A5E4PT65_9NEOP|nr:unnamed protein product [Leptidea sinapis]
MITTLYTICSASQMFRNIAFRAELDRHITPECEDQARILCGEVPAERNNKIEELRKMILERGECNPPRLDDVFLLRFLRARQCIPARAHRLMVRYCTFREQNPHLWRDVYWYGLARLGNVYEGVLYDRPDVGRLIIGRLGLYDPDKFSPDELIRGCLLLLEVGIMQPKLQVLGGTALVDCEGTTLKQMRQLTPSLVTQAMSVMGYAFPLRQIGVHIVNCSGLIEKLFFLFKRLAPADDLWKRVYFHGCDYTSLHR